MTSGIQQALLIARGVSNHATGKVSIPPKPALIPMSWFTAMTGPEQDVMNEILIEEGIAAIPANGGKALLLIKATIVHDEIW